MPKSNLNADAVKRIQAGLCACGCGVPIPRSAPYLGSSRHVDAEGLYASAACRQRAYRARAKRGEVRTRDERRADALRAEATRMLRSAEHAESTVRYYTAEAAGLRKRATELEAEAAALVKIPGDRPRRRAKGTDAGAVARPVLDVEAVEREMVGWAFTRDTSAPELARHVDDQNAGEDLRTASRAPAPCAYCGKPSTGQTMARAFRGERERAWRATCDACGTAIYMGADPLTLGEPAPVLGAPGAVTEHPRKLTGAQRQLLIRIVEETDRTIREGVRMGARIGDGRDQRVVRVLDDLRLVNVAGDGSTGPMLVLPSKLGRRAVGAE